MGLDPKSVVPSEIRADYEAMQTRKTALERTYKSAEKEVKMLQQKMLNVEQFIGYSIAKDVQQTSLNPLDKTSRS